MNLSWDLIRSFDAVARTGSLLAAARSLGVAQPTVGRHIDTLEATLAVTLFTRSREGMTLTDAGADLVGSAGDLARAANDFSRRASGHDATFAGTVRLSANDVLGHYVLPGVLARFMATYPEISVELEISNSPANLTRRDADIALRMFRPQQNDLIARKVTEIPLGFYTSATYVADHGQPTNLADLAAHRTIGFDRETLHIDAARALGVTLTRDDFAFRCDTIPVQIESVRAGLGIGILHDGFAARDPNLIRLMPDITLPALELWIVCHQEVRYNRRMRLLMDHLAEALRHPYA